jgi:TnpA family transposase
VRTNFLLVYCADPAERARIAGQLNKGETLHALRRHLVIGSRAQIPADEDDHDATPCACRSSSTPSRSGTPAT